MIIEHFLKAGVGIEVVKGLRQETGYIDTVGRSEFHVLVQFGIHEGVLYQCLTVVKDTVDLDGRDILAQCGKLAFLDGADFSFRIQYIDMDTFHAKESVGYGRACVSGSGYEDVDILRDERLARLLFFDKVLE